MTRRLLLLHGALGSSEQFKLLIPSLEAAGFECFTINFSGHGGEPFKDSFGIETFADEVDRFLTMNGLSAIDVFGYSMGGYVALWLAIRHPARVQRIVTLGTKFDWSPGTAAQEVRKLDPEKIAEKVPAFATLLRDRHEPVDWKQLVHATARMMEDLGQRPLLTEENLSKITQRVLIMLGDKDDMADRRSSRTFADCIQGGQFMLLQDTPHALEKVRTADLARILETFHQH